MATKLTNHETRVLFQMKIGDICFPNELAKLFKRGISRNVWHSLAKKGFVKLYDVYYGYPGFIIKEKDAPTALKYADKFVEFTDALSEYTMACKQLYDEKNSPTGIDLESLRLKQHDTKMVVLRIFNNVLTELQEKDGESRLCKNP